MNAPLHNQWPQAESPTNDVLVLEEVLQRFQREATHGTCDTGRYRCPYYVWGEATAPPLVFVHGLVDDSTSFVLPISQLSRYFRCVAYDLPTGCGDGARLGRYQHADLVDDLTALLDHLHLNRAYLYGSSFGSTVVLAALHKAPRRFPRAVLQGGFARRRLAPAELLLARLARYWEGPMGWVPFRTELLAQGYQATFQHREPAVWTYFLQRANTPPMEAVARRALLMNQLDLGTLLPTIAQPILLVCGACDSLIGRESEDVLLQGLPHAMRGAIEGCGHYPYFTHPEVLAEVVYRFLTPLPCHTG